MNAAEAMRFARACIEARAGQDAAFEARQLLMQVLKPDALRADAVLTPLQETELARLCRLRAAGNPLQYLLGEWAFMGLPMTVRPGALIPRADTETLALAAETAILERGYRTALDLCCGSGCIGVALQKRTGVAVTAADISPEAVSLTRENAIRNGVCIDVRQGDLFAALAGEAFDLIVCNPPYLSAVDMRHMQTELTHEPALALYGGPDGLGFYRRIAEGWRRHLHKNGLLLLEIGCTQADAVGKLFPCAQTLCDLEGRARVIKVEEVCSTN